MNRIKIELPESFSFTTDIPVRITDINYGGHVGNDAVLSIIHETRMLFLRHHGYTEMDFAGTSMIMSDVVIEFKNELFYGDTIKASVALADMSKIFFALYYKLEKETSSGVVTAAVARTGMVCYNYTLKKTVPVPQAIKDLFTR